MQAIAKRICRFEDIYENEYYDANTALNSEHTVDSKKNDSSNEDYLNIESVYCEKTSSSTTEPWKKELNEYINSPRASSNESILDWWKKNSKSFPTLAKIAKKKNSILSVYILYN